MVNEIILLDEKILTACIRTSTHLHIKARAVPVSICRFSFL
jgi:hypothetical protein